MDMDIPALLPNEKEALLEALRRDLRSQRSLAMHDTGWAIWHQRNAQLNVRLLEVLNPKRREFIKPVFEDFLTKCAASKRMQKGPQCLRSCYAQSLFQKTFAHLLSYGHPAA